MLRRHIVRAARTYINWFRRRKLKDFVQLFIVATITFYISFDIINTLRIKSRKPAVIQRQDHSIQKPENPSATTTSTTKASPSSSITPKHQYGSSILCTQEHRKARLEAYCESQRQSGSPPCHPWTTNAKLTARQILVDDTRQVLYCEVPKAACSSWKTFFLTLTGKVNPEALHKDYLLAHQTTLYKKVGLKYLHEYTPAERLYRIQYYFKFLVTRSPYERVTSAYQDKILGTEWYQKYVGKWIMRHYRQKPDKEALDTGRNVTFSEFVRFISNPNELKVFQVHDAHWMSTAALCCPCMYKFDYIGKVETMPEDAEELMKKIVPGRSNISLTHSHTLQGNKAQKIVQGMISTLSSKEKKGLDRLFKDDFKMFDYSYDNKHKPLCGAEDGCC